MAKAETTTKDKLFDIVVRSVPYLILIGVSISLILISMTSSGEPQMPKIELASMDFTVPNITQTGLSAKWDMSIRIPNDLPGHYICLQGDLQASLLYKNVTLATSSPQKYYDLEYYHPQILKVSTVVSDEDIIGGLIGKDFIKDIKERKEIQFGTQFFLTDCRQDTTGVMSYACDEATLRFEPGSDMKAIVFGNHQICSNF